MIIRFCVCIASNSYIIQQSVKCLEQTLRAQIKHISDVQETFAFSLTHVWTKVGDRANTVFQCLRILQYFIGTYVAVKENVASHGIVSINGCDEFNLI